MATKKTAKTAAPLAPAAIAKATDTILAAAAGTAQPDQAPAIEPQPESYTDAPADEPAVVVAPVFTLADARALPEVPYDLCNTMPLVHDAQINAFKDDDGRTMQVGVSPAGVCKFQPV